MKAEHPRSFQNAAGPHRFTPCRNAVELDGDDTMRELREMWPSTVELAKQPGLLYRLQACLNA